MSPPLRNTRHVPEFLIPGREGFWCPQQRLAEGAIRALPVEKGLSEEGVGSAEKVADKLLGLPSRSLHFLRAEKKGSGTVDRVTGVSFPGGGGVQ